jgi:hypothetical protein
MAEAPGVRKALAALAGCTSTPNTAYVAIWEGWCGTGSAQGAGEGQEPHLVWPEDRAWCLACEVDEEIEFTVGCSGNAAQVLAEALPGAVRRAHYGEPAPPYLEPE